MTETLHWSELKEIPISELSNHAPGCGREYFCVAQFYTNGNYRSIGDR